MDSPLLQIFHTLFNPCNATVVDDLQHQITVVSGCFCRFDKGHAVHRAGAENVVLPLDGCGIRKVQKAQIVLDRFECLGGILLRKNVRSVENDLYSWIGKLLLKAFELRDLVCLLYTSDAADD